MDELNIKLQLTTVYGRLVGEPSSPLILGIHGWSQRNGWHTWEPLMEPLAEAGFCVVSVDMPGWGNSKPMDALPLAGNRAAAVVMEIMDGLQKETAVLMGKSWGGGVAIKTAVNHPNRISQLILTAPALRDFTQLARLEQPVLLTWAEDDPVIPFVFAQKYVEGVKNIKFVSYPTGGHSAAQKNRVAFAKEAIPFLMKNNP